MKKLTYRLGFFVAVAALVAGCRTTHNEEVYVSWDSVPVVVQATIQSHQFGGTVSTVEKETSKCGTVYEARVKGSNGQCSEVKVAEDGKLIKYKTSKKECKD
jgi:hypothetical protein